ncbi:MAG: hypothetical protein Q4A85_08510, partial [Kingella sp. (in: b-proteobacteria)]
MPARIERQLKLLLSRREAEIQRLMQNAQAGAPFFALWYQSRHDCPPFFEHKNHEASVIDRKLSQSIASAIVAQGGRVVHLMPKNSAHGKRNTRFQATRARRMTAGRWMNTWWCPKKYADLIMVDSKQYWVKTPQSVPSPASGGRNSSAAYFLGHYQNLNQICFGKICHKRNKS